MQIVTNINEEAINEIAKLLAEKEKIIGVRRTSFKEHLDRSSDRGLYNNQEIINNALYEHCDLLIKDLNREIDILVKGYE